LFINEVRVIKLVCMVEIVIENLAQKQLSPVDPSESILHIVQSHFIDWMHACGGKGRCTTCKMIVVEGMEQLSRLTPAEMKYQQLGELKENERLTCQTRALGSCRIRVPDESKMPHMDYTS
jgi:2Fe-2S ferredoxin